MNRYQISLSLVVCLQGTLFGSHQSAAQESNAAYYAKLATHTVIAALTAKKGAVAASDLWYSIEKARIDKLSLALFQEKQSIQEAIFLEKNYAFRKHMRLKDDFFWVIPSTLGEPLSDQNDPYNLGRRSREITDFWNKGIHKKQLVETFSYSVFFFITLDTLRRKSKSGYVLPDELSPYYWLSPYVPKCMEFEVNLFGVRFL